MKTKFGILAVGLSLLSASAFADDQSREVVTIQIEGRTIATISMKEQPEDARLHIQTAPKSSVIYDAVKSTATIKGKFSVKVMQGEKSLLHIDAEDGVAVWSRPSTTPSTPVSPVVPVQVPVNTTGNFCGHAEMTRLFIAMQLKEQRERAEAARLAATKTATPPATETAAPAATEVAAPAAEIAPQK